MNKHKKASKQSKMHGHLSLDLQDLTFHKKKVVNKDYFMEPESYICKGIFYLYSLESFIYDKLNNASKF